MRKYLLNSAVITSPGMYCYEHVDLDEATKWLEAGDWTSTIGYPETAEALSELTGLRIPVNRSVVTMQPGDQALVFRLVLPPGARRVAPGAKGGLGVGYILQHCEIGLLERVS
jgi:hypothetical protein